MKHKHLFFVLSITVLLTFAAASAVFANISEEQFTVAGNIDTAEESSTSHVELLYYPSDPPEVLDDGSIINDGCEIFPGIEPNEELIERIGEVSANDHIVGPDDAIMTLIEYADFECSFCAGATKQLEAWQKLHEDEVRLVYRHYPVGADTEAHASVYISEAAGLQGFFEEVRDFIYDNQSTWQSMTNKRFTDWFMNQAETIFPELDLAKLQEDLDSEELKNHVASLMDNSNIGTAVYVTPTVFIQSALTITSVTEVYLEDMLTVLKAEPLRYKDCPKFYLDKNYDYKAVIKTSEGDLDVELFEDEAPLGVANFVYLAENGWYNDTPFTAKENNFAVQFGDPTGTGYVNSGYTFEIEQTDYRDGLGYLGYVSGNNVKNSSAVFITYNIFDFYKDLFETNASEDDELSPEENAEILTDLFFRKYTTFGKVSDETYPVAEKLNEKSIIYEIEIIKEEK